MTNDITYLGYKEAYMMVLGSKIYGTLKINIIQILKIKSWKDVYSSSNININININIYLYLYLYIQRQSCHKKMRFLNP